MLLVLVQLFGDWMDSFLGKERYIAMRHSLNQAEDELKFILKSE